MPQLFAATKKGCRGSCRAAPSIIAIQDKHQETIGYADSISWSTGPRFLSANPAPRVLGVKLVLGVK
jgi:hypothetical protein